MANDRTMDLGKESCSMTGKIYLFRKTSYQQNYSQCLNNSHFTGLFKALHLHDSVLLSTFNRILPSAVDKRYCYKLNNPLDAEMCQYVRVPESIPDVSFSSQPLVLDFM